jgi:hypothetical protein
MKNAYFVMDNASRRPVPDAGFVVKIGNPETATGETEGEFLTLREAVAFIQGENADYFYRVFRTNEKDEYQVKFVRIGGMLVFENGLDIRTRFAPAPEVAKIRIDGVYRFCVIGTQYGHIHTTGGDVRTWGTAGSARRFARNYKPF